MAIPSDQLERWCNIGATVLSTRTYDSVKFALCDASWPNDEAPDLYLQGSYRNATNIRADSDVDIVVEAPIFRLDVAGLPTLEAQAANKAFPNATYDWPDLHAATLQALQDHYGKSAVQIGTKAIRVQTAHLTADVVVALGYKKYKSFYLGQVADGIAVWVPTENDWIFNFPRLHYRNGAEKNNSTDGLFKPTVRLFKNANRYMAERELIGANIAPSYAIECLVYSVPSEDFDTDCGQNFCNIVNWARKNLSKIRRVSEQGTMIGDEKGQWRSAAARTYVNALTNLWNRWS